MGHPDILPFIRSEEAFYSFHTDGEYAWILRTEQDGTQSIALPRTPVEVLRTWRNGREAVKTVMQIPPDASAEDVSPPETIRLPHNSSDALD